MSKQSPDANNIQHTSLKSEKQKYSTPWSYKPWWCQPWSILLTGVILIFSSWVLAKTLWVTILFSIPVAIWMGYFLLLWPRLMRTYQPTAPQDSAQDSGNQ